MVMATVTLSSFSAVSLLLTPSQIGTNSIRFFFKPLLTSSSSSSSSSRSSIFKHTFAPKVLASSTAFVQTKPDSISGVKEVSTDKNILACPICYERLIWNGDPVLSVDSVPRCSLQCGTCKKAYFGNETHIDLTVASGAKEYGEAMPASTELFRNFILVRADISRLPFASSSVDAVHAGAALHCWPSPSAAVAEISRVLRPGGVFVATTYILDGPFAVVPFLRPLRRNIGQFSGSHVFLAESELEDLCNACGLVGFTCNRNGQFVMISATKPS
ncbi:hypothetical protein HYC85_008147 [Camellia sinensis]|uniref:Methyltransferase type 11 domain-containing protein n=1 Tax=Camellia sinensis TaxID=4442 RepID=A0A7J7HSS4_CAMSI|nr:hypothetical protein HYC85_008147 [Camellia sinensis]